MSAAKDLSKVTVEISVQQLRTGLYVSNLDRSWTETPFLFQGFVIETDEEISQLKSLCKRVHVEVTMEEARELVAQEKKSSAKAPPKPDQFAELALDPSALLQRVPPKDTVALRTELGNAQQTLSLARETVGRLFDKLRRGGGLDVPNLDTVVDSMVDSVMRNRDAMALLAHLKSKDDYLYRHSLATSVWALALGRHMGLDKDALKVLGVGAMLLDIGKTKLSDEMLRGKDKLAEADWELMREHVTHGVEQLRATGGVDPQIVRMVLTHHERHDGSGYPSGLAGNDIPLIGRIAAIVDSYDAMTADRAYAKARSTFDAIRELKRMAGTAYSPELVELFIQAVGVFPTGSLVELNTGEVGIVVGQNRFRRLRPELMIVVGPDKQALDDYRMLDLQTCPENNVADNQQAVWITRGHEAGAFGIDPTEHFL